jgi:hypothetical protein
MINACRSFFSIVILSNIFQKLKYENHIGNNPINNFFICKLMHFYSKMPAMTYSQLQFIKAEAAFKKGNKNNSINCV